MFVFVAGMPRSGSTFSFNIVRELLERSGTTETCYAETLDAALSSPPAMHLVIKGHDADTKMMDLVRRGTVKCVCTVRNVEDAVASRMATFGFSVEAAIVDVQRWLEMFKVISPNSLVLDYELINDDPTSAARAIAKYLEIGGSVDDIAGRYTREAVKALSDRVASGEGDLVDIGVSFYDRQTMFHRNHVASLTEVPARDRISAEDLTKIREAFMTQTPQPYERLASAA